MKRAISLLLTFTVLFSVLSVSVYAKGIEIDKDFYDKAEKYARDCGILGMPYDTGLGFTVEHKYEFYYVSSQLLVFSIADEWNESPTCTVKNYEFTGHAYYGNCDNGLTVYDGNNCYKISDAVDKGLVSLEFLAEVIPNTKKIDLQSYSEKFHLAVKTYVEENGIKVIDTDNVDSYVKIYYDSTRAVLFEINDNSNKEQKININYTFYTYTLTNKSFEAEDSDAGFFVYYYGNIYKLSEAVKKDIISPGTVINNISNEKMESTVLTKAEFNSLLENYIKSINAQSRVKRYSSGTNKGDIMCDFFKHTDEVIAFRILSNYIWNCKQTIGNHTFISGTKLSDENPCGYCIYKDGVIYSLSDAYDKKLINNSDLKKLLTKYDAAEQDREIIRSIITDYCQKLDIAEFSPEDYDIVYMRDNDIIVIHGFLGCATHGERVSEKFGDYFATSSYDMFPYILGYYVIYPKENTMYNLHDAYLKKLSGVEELFAEGHIGHRYGDANGDKKFDIQDASAIQKYIAKIYTGFDDVLLSGKFEYNGIYDFNIDGKININDATALQKYLAKLN